MRKNTLLNLQSRRNPERILNEAFANTQEDEGVKYLVGCMEPVDPFYTQKTFEEADRVANQIEKGLEREKLTGEYRYQGSVPKNTHIRAYSDIDLLVLEKRFLSLEPPQQAFPPYLGSPIEDLFQIR